MEMNVERSSLRMVYSFGLTQDMIANEVRPEDIEGFEDARKVLKRAADIFEAKCRSEIQDFFVKPPLFPNDPVLRASEAPSVRNKMLCAMISFVLDGAALDVAQLLRMHRLTQSCVDRANEEMGASLKFEGAVVMNDTYAEFTAQDLA